MIYPTVKATIRHGQVVLLDDIRLPENASLLVTVIDDDVIDSLTLGEHLIVALEDILSGRVTEVTTADQLDRHLETIFEEA